MGFVRPQSWETCECTRISTFLFFSGVIFWPWWFQGKAKNPRNPNNAKGRRQRKELPFYNLKEYAFAGVLRESCELGLAEIWEHSTGPCSSTSFGDGVQSYTLLRALLLGSPSPRTQHHPSQAAFPLLTKTKDALYVQAASAKKNKLKRCLFLPGTHRETNANINNPYVRAQLLWNNKRRWHCNPGP